MPLLIQCIQLVVFLFFFFWSYRSYITIFLLLNQTPKSTLIQANREMMHKFCKLSGFVQVMVNLEGHGM